MIVFVFVFVFVRRRPADRAESKGDSWPQRDNATSKSTKSGDTEAGKQATTTTRTT